jgi:hypothetical protein
MSRNTTWWSDDAGTVAVIAALVIPVVLVLMAAAVDLGITMVRKARIVSTSELAVQAGAVTIGDLIIQYAEANNPPPEATDPLLYLTDDDIIAITSHTLVTEKVQEYITLNRTGVGEVPVIDVWYPDNSIFCDGTAEQRRVDLKVRIQESFPTLFAGVLFGTDQTTIEATSLQSIRICP